MKITVLGAGSFGTSLAHLFAKKGHQVKIWSRKKSIVDSINQKRINPDYLSSIELAPMQSSVDLMDCLEGSELLIFSIPTQYLRSVIEQISTDHFKNKIIVNTSKGIEKDTLYLPSQIFADFLNDTAMKQFSVLSGPTFAIELAQEEPTGAVIASKNLQLAQRLQKELSYQWFRLYSSQDLLGVELGGALKNVMAIGAGMAEGLGFGHNSQAGFITRCLAEMTRLGVKMGADPLTFSGLSGLGDLVLTCTGHLSRNRSLGYRLGKGEKLEDILQEMDSVAEGVSSALSIRALAQKYQSEMPNASFVYRILYEGLSLQEVLLEMRERNLKSETEGFS